MKTKEERELLQYKFDFFVKNYTEGVEEIRRKIGIDSAGTLNSFRSLKFKSSISKIYMESLEKHYHIPLKFWDKHIPCNEKKLKEIIDNYQQDLKEKKEEEKENSELLKKLKEEVLLLKKKNKVLKEAQTKISLNLDTNFFKKDIDLQNKLLGEWNTHLYSSTYERTKKIHIFKTYFQENNSVFDVYKNNGKFFIGEHQTIVFKKTPNEKNFSLIVFQNNNITYKVVIFAIISIQNGTHEEMMQYGFYSKKEYSYEETKKILGEVNNLQLKLDLDFARRIRDEFVVR